LQPPNAASEATVIGERDSSQGLAPPTTPTAYGLVHSSSECVAINDQRAKQRGHPASDEHRLPALQSCGPSQAQDDSCVPLFPGSSQERGGANWHPAPWQLEVEQRKAKGCPLESENLEWIAGRSQHVCKGAGLRVLKRRPDALEEGTGGRLQLPSTGSVLWLEAKPVSQSGGRRLAHDEAEQ